MARTVIGVDLRRSRLGNKEAHALNLLDVIESQDSNVGVRVVALAFSNLSHNLAGVGGAEHWKLPHGPVTSIVVSRHTRVLTVGYALFIELNARDKTVSKHVVDLGLHIPLSEIRHVRHGLVSHVGGRVNNFLAVGVSNCRAESRSWSDGAVEGRDRHPVGNRSAKLSLRSEGYKTHQGSAQGNVGNNAEKQLSVCVLLEFGRR